MLKNLQMCARKPAGTLIYKANKLCAIIFCALLILIGSTQSLFSVNLAQAESQQPARLTPESQLSLPSVHSLTALLCSVQTYQTLSVKTSHPTVSRLSTHKWVITKNSNSISVEGYCNKSLGLADQKNIHMTWTFDHDQGLQLQGQIGTQSVELNHTRSRYYSEVEKKIVENFSLQSVSLGHSLFDILQSGLMGYYLSPWMNYWLPQIKSNEPINFDFQAAKSYGDRLLLVRTQSSTNDLRVLLVDTASLQILEDNSGRGSANADDRANNVYKYTGYQAKGCSNLRFSSLGSQLNSINFADCTRIISQDN